MRAMTYDTEHGRGDLAAFEREQPENFWQADAHLRRVLASLAGSDELAAWQDQMDAFGALCAGPIDAEVRLNNLGENLPVLDRWSSSGERIEEVRHHGSFHEAGRLIYGSGIMELLREPGQNLRALTLFYLSSHNGEAGHNCPLACTAGVIKSLVAVGSPALRERYLGRLTSPDYDRLAHGAQFLTEVQGGSDVGANSVRAEPVASGEGMWSLHGEKWFCSNVPADLILVTARPQGARAGTAGLGLFLMPRRLSDGSLNAFAIRRLKDKVGTRTLPTAELDLNGAVAFEVGPIEDGFRNTMTHVINTSRVFNAAGCAGIARRASLVAHGYAARRGAFGGRILDYPLTQETLADMRSETAAMVSGTFQVIHALDRAERGQASASERAFLRVGVNLNKMRAALSSHEVALLGVEVLGGNGTIETFSVLPRLMRDNLVFENWEGSHNVLLLQVLRDCQRKGVHRGFFERVRESAPGHGRLAAALSAAERDFEELLAAPEAEASVRMRPMGSRLAFLQWAAAMIADGTDAELVEHFLDRRIGPAAVRDAEYLGRLGRLSREA